MRRHSTLKLFACLLVVLCLDALVVKAADADTGSSTAYHLCDGSTQMTASGRLAQWGTIANNYLPLGTWVEMQSPRRINGRRYFQVLDRGGPGFIMDIWAPSCAWMNTWGRRTVTFKVLGRRDLWHGRPRGGWLARKPWQHDLWRG